MNTVIETARLQLRPLRLDDAEPFLRLASDPEVIRYVGNEPLTSVEAVREMLLHGPLHDYAQYGYGRFACVWKASGQLIGFSGLKFVAEVNDTELGYRFLPEFWGMGLATEAGLASIDYARDTLGLKRLVGLVHPDNHGSAKVMRKLGFVYEQSRAVSLFAGVDADVYARAL